MQSKPQPYQRYGICLESKVRFLASYQLVRESVTFVTNVKFSPIGWVFAKPQIEVKYFGGTPCRSVNTVRVCLIGMDKLEMDIV